MIFNGIYVVVYSTQPGQGQRELKFPRRGKRIEIGVILHSEGEHLQLTDTRVVSILTGPTVSVILEVSTDSIAGSLLILIEQCLCVIAYPDYSLKSVWQGNYH